MTDTTGPAFTQNMFSRLGARPFVAVLLLIMTVLIVLPIAVLVVGSFLDQPPRAMQIDWSGLTLSNYTHMLTDPNLMRVFGTTLRLAAGGTIGAAIIGTALAWVTTRADIPRPGIFAVLAVAPMFIPALVGAFAWDLLGSPANGILNIFARSVGLPLSINIYTELGIIFVFSIYYAPYVYLFLAGAMRNMDATLEEAAAISGAGRLRTGLKITLPLMLPNLLSACLLVFVLLIELFAIPAVLGPPQNINVVAVYIWELVNYLPSRVNEASAHGVLLLVVVALLVFLQHRVLRNRSFVVVAGKGRRPQRVSLGRYKYLVAALLGIYVLVVVVLPYLALLIVAFRRNLFFNDLGRMLDFSQYSVNQFAFVLADPIMQQSIWNSLVLSLATMVIGTALYFLVSYAIKRSQVPGARLLDFISLMPIAIPGMILSLGYLWMWIGLPLPVYGTMLILVLAFIAQFSPQGVRTISGALGQIHPELEEGARVSGGSAFYTMRRITLPLVMPGVLSAMVLVLVLSFRELAAALFLYNARTQIFSVTMFEYWAKGSNAAVAIMAIIQTGILLTIALIGWLIGGLNRGVGKDAHE